MYCRSRGLAFSVFLVCLAGCGRQGAKPSLERIAILRFENLGPDESADWIGRAIPVMLDAELADAPNIAMVGTSQVHTLDAALGARPISSPGVSSERSQALLAGANQIAYGDYAVSAGRLRARLWLEDERTQKIVKVAEVSTAASDSIGASAGLARQLATRTTGYFTHSEAAIRAYAEGLESKDIASAAARMEEAIAADPDFGPGYRSLAELEAQRQDRGAAMAVLARGLARGGIPAIERARIQSDAAVLQGDAAGKQGALAALAKLEPGNVRTLQSLAETAMARHDYATSIDAYRRALAIDPENATLLNEFGYAAAYGGHIEEGLAALEKYRALRPKDPNAVDSLGDLNLISNRYRQAEDFYLASAKLDPTFNGNSDLFKAALARAMTGDLAGADDLYKQFIAARALGHDANAAFLHGEWLWLTGRRKQASDELMAYAHAAETHNDRPSASRAYAGMAVWRLMANDRPGAQEAADHAVKLADPSSAGPALIARFLAQPSVPAAEWETRADRFIPNPAQTGVKNEMLAWALLFDHQFQAAKVPLRKIYDATGTASNEGVPVLLAWCDVEAGNVDDAAPLLTLTPVPSSTGVSTFMPLWFPRIFELRAAVSGKTGKADEAKQNLELFRKLSGG